VKEELIVLEKLIKIIIKDDANRVKRRIGHTYRLKSLSLACKK
jgi:hypothetical protein